MFSADTNQPMDTTYYFGLQLVSFLMMKLFWAIHASINASFTHTRVSNPNKIFAVPRWMLVELLLLPVIGATLGISSHWFTSSQGKSYNTSSVEIIGSSI